MMAFTDDDLKRLEEMLQRYDLSDVTFEQWNALLARLEAAERVCRAAHMVDEGTMNAWRKAAGK
jgi:hypothetical protein